MAFLSDVHRLCGAIEERLSLFLQRCLRRGWHEKSLKMLHHDWEWNPDHREDILIEKHSFPLSYHDPGQEEDRQ